MNNLKSPVTTVVANKPLHSFTVDKIGDTPNQKNYTLYSITLGAPSGLDGQVFCEYIISEHGNMAVYVTSDENVRIESVELQSLNWYETAVLLQTKVAFFFNDNSQVLEAYGRTHHHDDDTIEAIKERALKCEWLTLRHPA